ncbi:MAG: helix-turn-helix domain-containing protein [Myxococcales bacterium]|nr:helix-turn-helix domain-containing protein [Myxococcales bacterium]
MDSLGRYLRENREAKGVTLEQIAEATKIPKGSLEYLESDQYEFLPADVFVRGFIRTYCKNINIEPNHALSLYHERKGRPAQALREYGRIVSPTDEPESGRGLRLSHMLLILIAIVTFVVAFMTVGSEREKETLSSQKIIRKIEKSRHR